MAIPVILPTGTILVYGRGIEQSASGLVVEDTSIKFANVYQVWQGGEVFVYAGDNVMFGPNDVICTLAQNNIPYTMLKFSGVTKEVILP